MENLKKCLAEFIGTMVLVIIGCGVAVYTGDVVATSLAFGFVIVAMAYSIGNISGCHINPAVSLAMLIRKKITVKEFFMYVGSQILGAIIGALILGFILGSFRSLGCNFVDHSLLDARSDAVDYIVGLVTEIILTFVFVMAILGVTSRKQYASCSGIVIGITLTLVHLLGISITGTSVNPARSLGPALITLFDGKTEAISQIWVFIVGPLIGACLAAVVYGFLDKNASKKESNEASSNE